MIHFFSLCFQLSIKEVPQLLNFQEPITFEITNEYI